MYLDSNTSYKLIMYGWMITNCCDYKVLDSMDSFEEIHCGEYVFLRNHNNRFTKDTIFDETEKYVVILDGVVFNKNDLVKNSKLNWRDTIINLFTVNHDNLPRTLRGPFSGAVFNKITNELFTFTNHTGDSGVFYYSDVDDKIIISNNFRWIVQTLRNNKIKYYLCADAVKYMCTFGFMIDNITFVDKINRLLPGQSLIYFENTIAINYYHIISNVNTINMTDQEIIDRIDVLFRQAINREFSKDKEYGYKSVVDLSGGLDCRVINYVAKDMGFDNVINVSFSQIGSDEYKAMMELSKDLKNPLLFIPLDKAEHLYDIDKIVAKNYGLSFYAGVGALIEIIDNLDMNKHGLEHGGVMGEMADGVFPGSGYTKHTRATFETGMPFCRLLSLDILNADLLDSYPNTELFTIIGRGLLGGACPQLIRREFTGYASPFEDIDYYDFFLSIPLEIRGGKKILQKWVAQKYPEAFNIIEDKLMCKPNSNKFVKSKNKFIRKVKGKIVDYFGKSHPELTKNNMNPMEYWYAKYPQLRSFILNYYNDNIELLKSYPDAYSMVSYLFNKGEIKEKLIAMTVLSVMKQFF